MIESARLPPIYKLIPLGAADDPMARARDLAAGGEDPATILCIDSENFFDCAVILHPEMSLAESRLALYVGMLGLGDAIGSVVPAGIDITYRWPNTIDANVGIIAQVQLASPPGIAEATEPPWLVLRASVAVSNGQPDGWAGAQFETTLVGEGAADLTPPLLLESFSRHFLSWMNLWQNDGYSPVRAMWLSHSAEQGKKIEFSTGSHVSQGVFETIDEEGALVLDDEGATIRVPLNLIFSS
jgi:BirA family biotin operon repressor/biotin-[acetyl-CoA-carboxylase] ligase